MPIITIETWPMDKKSKADVMKKVTDVFVGMGIPAQAVTIVIHETAMENWGSAGEQHSVKFKDMKR
ncbi:4-oxalocrotonate tautomerase [Candidatus Woesearchaeota archaeon CG10_big_fil_rev_8_21_14_0_10_44_13]|nr:MAG: 4-oxalocrotonate tautomerase [Candidatus Woesearchaeota archaeon CG10_big_fil_rev_8_21_14_0_10_44_13]